MSTVLQTRSERRERLYAKLVEEGRRFSPAGHAIHDRAAASLIDGGSHTARLVPQLPFWVSETAGGHVTDVDHHDILDLWQGHFANLLGHNPPAITEPLADALHRGFGLQTGMQHVVEAEAAELVRRCTGTERVRFTTSGSLATMYAILLSKVSTGRELVLKVGGGWHGAQPWGLVGVHFGAKGYSEPETEGLPEPFLHQVRVTRFNDIEALEMAFRKDGDRIACFILEPFIGAGGGMAVSPEYLRAAREMTQRYGALLILDEIIAGFRFRAGNLAAFYGIQPDLMTLGKIMGGGMPVAAVAGREDVLALCGRAGGRRVRFEGGTYSAHPLSMLAARTMLQYLLDHGDDIYPGLGRLGHDARTRAVRAFGAEGIPVFVSGQPNSVALNGSSLVFLGFPHHSGASVEYPDQLNDPSVCDVDLRERVVKLAFLLEGVFVVHCGGGLSTAHTTDDLNWWEGACQSVARRLQAAGTRAGMISELDGMRRAD